MKVVKQRFTQWFNKRHGRKGTLWEERFKSVLVEDGRATRVISAYIDLNPVRAGMVEDPARYRWSAYGAAVGGDQLARAGIARTMELFAEEVTYVVEALDWRKVAGMYRVILFEDGEEQFAEVGSGPERQVKRVRRGVSAEAVERERKSGGKMGRAKLLRLKVRQFVEGMVVGTREYVNAAYAARRECFGPKRKDGFRC